ncbi:MAG TPA: ATP-binding protein, partial [Gemmatimonadaceae bacterium]|nr:ATP-binding protein [Gemmatimonadaceae bacterium]
RMIGNRQLKGGSRPRPFPDPMTVRHDDVLDDPQRLEALRRAALLDTPAEAAFDRLTTLASRILGVPVSLVSLVDSDRQFFKSQVGLPEPWASLRETPLTHSFCQHVVRDASPLVVSDARDNPLVRDNLAVRDLGVIAYAGIPLVTSDGQTLGSFCAIDSKPRRWTEDELSILRELTALAISEIELRAALARADELARSNESAQRALRESEARLRGIYNNAGVGITITTPRGDVIDCNRAYEELTGYRCHELASRGFASFMHADDVAEQERLLEELVAGTRDEFELEKRYIRPNGQVVWGRVTATVARDERGEPWFIVGIVENITARKRADDALRLLAEAGAVLSSSLDYAQTLQRVARLAVPALGDAAIVDVVHADGTTESACAHADPSQALVLRAMRERYPARADGLRGPVAATMAKKRAEIIPFVTDELRASTASDAEHLAMLQQLDLRSALHVPLLQDDRAIGAITFASRSHRYCEDDVPFAEELARRAVLALENARLYEAERQATRARDEVLAIVSHDLRNPLHTILLGAGAASELLPDGLPAVRSSLEMVRRAAHRAERLIRDLLDITRIESGHLELDRAAVPVAELLAEAAESAAPRAREARITLGIDQQSDGQMVSVDRHRALQVLDNLLSNALKFTPAGGQVRIGARLIGGEETFWVADSGPGIPAEQQQFLFRRFWQSRRADRRGIGLGLTIAKGVVDAHGGRIWVESAAGKGTTFWFTLPAVSDGRREGGVETAVPTAAVEAERLRP